MRSSDAAACDGAGDGGEGRDVQRHRTAHGRGVCAGAGVRVVVSLCAVAVAAAEAVATPNGGQCPLIDTARWPSPNWGLRNCSFFRPRACCTAHEVQLAMGPSMQQASLTMEGVDVDPEWQHLQCRNHLDYLMCHFCSPLQSGWVDRR